MIVWRVWPVGLTEKFKRRARPEGEPAARAQGSAEPADAVRRAHMAAVIHGRDLFDEASVLLPRASTTRPC
jgi:hypothetical protein